MNSHLDPWVMFKRKCYRDYNLSAYKLEDNECNQTI